MDEERLAAVLDSMGAYRWPRPLTAKEESELDHYVLGLPHEIRSDAVSLNAAILDWARRHGL